MLWFILDMAEHGSLDYVTLAEYDEELDALRSIQKRLERRVASVGRKRNTLALINTLPRELLVDVFTHAIEYEPDTVRSNNEALMLVCHSWYLMVNNTPSLWTNIRKTAAISNACVIRALENSKDSPLEIEYDASPAERSPGDQEAFLNAIFPHAHHWRKATLRFHGDAQGLGRMATLSGSLLQSLSLWADNYPRRDGEEPLDIFGGRLPAGLREVFLGGIAVTWSPTTLCNLEVLEIISIRHHGPSVDQVLAVLGASPSLESLAMRVVNFSDGASTLLPNPVHMPTLRRLSLRVQPEITSQLLAGIRAPNCQFGDLQAVVSGDPFEYLFTPEISHSFDRIRSSAHAGSITCFPQGIWISWWGSWGINLGVDDIWTAGDVLNWLPVSPEPDSPVPLDLTIRESDPLFVEDIITVMADREAVHRVIFQEGTPVESALRMLPTGSSVEEGARELFPALNDMWIDAFLDDDEWGCLLHMLRGRQGETESRDSHQDLKPLRRLVLRMNPGPGYDEDKISEFRSIYWPNHLEEIRRLLGREGELRWCRRLVTEDGTLGDQPIPENRLN
ncbi:hypothetical protein FS837_004941 [Tulasnella sp. UAMH 9824]|nr:hypothetical protein FS837_004941 [Tulasnella sp. UAMH 9824]